MVIDTFIYPALFADICKDKKNFQFRCDEMNYHLMSPTEMDLLKKQLGLAEIKQAWLMPEDCSFDRGKAAISNEEIAQLTALAPELFVGFATADPRNPSAASVLRKAFIELDLQGFMVDTAKWKIYPNDERLYPLYQICSELGRPIIFHSGLSLESNAHSKYAQPILFEEVLQEFPDVKMCFAHFGWPWHNETAALLIKYPNAYANTAMMYMGSSYQMMRQVFKQDFPLSALIHNFPDKIMFGSDSPRIRPVRSFRGLRELSLDESVQRKIFCENAQRFLKGGC
ncbi:amidohydrolase family protein [Enterococcus sp. N249-2]